MRVSVAVALNRIDSSHDSAWELAINIEDEALKACVRAAETMKRNGCPSSVLSSFYMACREKFPRATQFWGEGAIESDARDPPHSQ